MIGVLLLIAAASGFRLIGALARREGTYWLLIVLGWVSSCLAAWLVASAMGAWAAWWPVLVVALAGFVLERRLDSRFIRPVADGAAAGLIGLLSIPIVTPIQMGLAISTAIAIGLSTEWLANRIRVRPLIFPAVIIVSLIIIIVAILDPQLVSQRWEGTIHDIQAIGSVSSGLSVFPRSKLIYLGVAPTPFRSGERIVLETGAVAWYDRPSGDGPFTGLVFYHGSGSDGAGDHVAMAVRRAAIDAGYAILSLDHIGFGQSPEPDRDADISDWDPLPSAAAAVEWLHAQPEVSSIVVAGYSMGAGDVLRVLPTAPEIDAAILLGASAIPSIEFNEFWYDSFHSDRKLEWRLAKQNYDEILRRFYNMNAMAVTLPEDHAPLLFINFEHELDLVLSRRDVLYDAINGCKRVWEFADTTHYVDMVDVVDLALGDTRATQELSEMLLQFASTLAEQDC
jgi:pimeloyl-ACP methyl ester carboxylesterase